MRESISEKYLRQSSYYPLWDLAKQIDRCQSCDLADSPHVLWRGNPAARICLVGQNPGKEEHQRGIPWCGPSGAELDRAFDYVGLLTERDVFITNICKARPLAPLGSETESLTPSNKQCQICSRFVLQELSLLSQIRVVIAAGVLPATALGIMDPGETLSRVNGKLRMLSIEGRDLPAVATYHTSRILRERNQDTKIELKYALARALQVAKRIATEG